MTYPIEKRKVRVFTWIILTLNVLMLIWLITALASSGQVDKSCPPSERSACAVGQGVGTFIGVSLFIALWAAMDVILGVLWLVTRRRRPQVIIIQSGGQPPAAPAAPPGRIQTAMHPSPQLQPVAQQVVAHQTGYATTQALPPAPDAGRPPKPRRTRTSPMVASQPIPPRRGNGPGGFEVFLHEQMTLTLTCGGTWGQTVLQVDGAVLIETTGAQQLSRTVFPTGHSVQFDVHTDGTWTVHLQRAALAAQLN